MLVLASRRSALAEPDEAAVGMRSSRLRRAGQPIAGLSCILVVQQAIPEPHRSRNVPGALTKSWNFESPCWPTRSVGGWADVYMKANNEKDPSDTRLLQLTLDLKR